MVYLIVLEIIFAIYILYRIIFASGSDEFLADTMGSPSFVAFLYFFLLTSYGLSRVLRTTRRIESLQTKQISLLAAQKFQIYYKRITYHPPEDDGDHDHDDTFSEGDDEDTNFMESLRRIEDSEPDEDEEEDEVVDGVGGDVVANGDDNGEEEDDDDDDDDFDVDALPMAEDPVEEPSESNSRSEEVKDDEDMDTPAKQLHSSSSGSTEENMLLNKPKDFLPLESNSKYLQKKESLVNLDAAGRARMRSMHRRALTQNVYADMEKTGQQVFSALYLEQSEKFVLAAMNICEAQDIIPRVFNVQINSAVGLSILCTTFAVIPTVVRLAFGDECDAASS